MAAGNGWSKSIRNNTKSLERSCNGGKGKDGESSIRYTYGAGLLLGVTLKASPASHNGFILLKGARLIFLKLFTDRRTGF